MDAIRKTVPETIAMQCRRSSERPTIEPAIWRDGRSPGEKTVGASTNAKKINPPSQTTSDKSMRKRRNVMSEIIEARATPLIQMCRKTYPQPEPALPLTPVRVTVYPHPSLSVRKESSECSVH